MTSVDVHQHLWGEHFIEALRARRDPPRLAGWTLHLRGEPPYEVRPADHDPARRAALARADGVDRALISLSAPLGIEWLPPEEGGPLLDAHHADAAALPAPFGAWAATSVREIDPAATAKNLDRAAGNLDRAADHRDRAASHTDRVAGDRDESAKNLDRAASHLDRAAGDRDGSAEDLGGSGDGLAGLQLPATALVDAAGYERCAPLLELLQDRGLPLLVHPGPVGDLGRDRPVWWPAVVPYVQQMHAAWFAFRAFGRPRHPRLRVCFALLAGLAPLHGERLAARGGGRGEIDPGAFVETSSYGPRAADAVVRALGIDQVVHGSDRPYAATTPADLSLGRAAAQAIRVTNPARLLTGEERPHAS